MAKLLCWQTAGYGDHDLILLHGWGLSSSVWSCLIKRLVSHFRLHLVNLPGYGCSKNDNTLTLEEITEEILLRAPYDALWVGWSLGGLIAMQAAWKKSYVIRGLITVASSPYFCAENNWPGIKPNLLYNFAKQMNENFVYTINRFLSLEMIANQSSYQEILWLKDILLKQPIPSTKIIAEGLNILYNSDLREVICYINIPFLRLYGYLDTLVPRKIVTLVDKLCPTSRSIIFNKSAHAPFISHPDLFCQTLLEFNRILS